VSSRGEIAAGGDAGSYKVAYHFIKSMPAQPARRNSIAVSASNGVMEQ
jgi:hypothetical protein